MKRHLTAAVLAATSLLAFVSLADNAAAGGRQRSQVTQDNFCLQGRDYGFATLCRFSTFEQCRATASGTGAGCVINPAKLTANRGGYRDRAYN